MIPTKPNRKVLPRHIISVLYFKRHAQDSPSQRLGPSRDENDLIVCTLFVFATDSSLRVGVIIPHLALCESNERERALGPGVGEDQEASVCVFPLTASGAKIDVEAMGYVTPVRRRETPPPTPVNRQLPTTDSPEVMVSNSDLQYVVNVSGVVIPGHYIHGQYVCSG